MARTRPKASPATIESPTRRVPRWTSPVATAQRYAGRVWHVHVKDVSARHLQRVRDEDVPYAQAVGEGVFVPLGQGSVDFSGLVEALSVQRYAGWWVLEQDVRLGPPWPEQDPKRNAAASLAYLRNLLDQHNY